MNQVLMLDDELLIIESIKRKVSWEACGVDRVFLCDNVPEARQIIQEHDIDLVICDIEMPGEDGVSFVQWLRDTQQEKMVFFLTGYAEFEYAQRAMLLRVADYILKPVDYAQLEEKIRRGMAEIARQRSERAMRFNLSELGESRLAECISYVTSKTSDFVETEAAALFERLHLPFVQGRFYAAAWVHFLTQDLGAWENAQKMRAAISDYCARKEDQQTLTCFTDNRMIAIISFASSDLSLDDLRSLMDAQVRDCAIACSCFISEAVPYEQILPMIRKISRRDAANVLYQNRVILVGTRNLSDTGSSLTGSSEIPGGPVNPHAEHTESQAGDTEALAGYAKTSSGYTEAAAGYTEAASGYTEASSGYTEAASGYTEAASGYTEAAARHTEAASGRKNPDGSFTDAAAGYMDVRTGTSNQDYASWGRMLDAQELDRLKNAVDFALHGKVIGGQMDADVLRDIHGHFTQMMFHYVGEKFGHREQILQNIRLRNLQDRALNSVEDFRRYAAAFIDAVRDSLADESQKSAVVEAQRYIDTHLAEKISRTELAAAVALNENYLSRLFHREAGMSISDYILEKRMSMAKSLLIQTRLSVSEIAERTGYDTTTYFIRMFKRETGMTPKEYRREKKL